MKIYKRESGLLVDDAFQSLDDWAVSDSNSVTLNDGLNMVHNENKDVRVMRDIPQGSGVFYFSIDYTPTLEGDEAGVILHRNNNESVELLEYKNGGQGELTDVRITKNGNEYTFEMLRNGEWEFVDSIEHPFTKVGLITKKGAPNFESLIATRFLALTSRYLTVMNLLEGFRVELGGESVTATSDGQIQLDIPNGEYTGTLKIYDELNTLISESTGTFYGGDQWNLGSFLILKKDGVELSHFDPTNLGRIVNNHLEVQLEVFNPAAIAALNLKLQVRQYTTHANGHVGWEWVDLALDNNGVPGAYDKEITFDTVNADSSVFFWVRIDKDSAVPQSSNSIYFTIYLSHE